MAAEQALADLWPGIDFTLPKEEPIGWALSSGNAGDMVQVVLNPPIEGQYGTIQEITPSDRLP